MGVILYTINPWSRHRKDVPKEFHFPPFLLSLRYSSLRVTGDKPGRTEAFLVGDAVGEVLRRGAGEDRVSSSLGSLFAVYFFVRSCLFVADARCFAFLLSWFPAFSGAGTRPFLLCGVDPWWINCKGGGGRSFFKNMEVRVSADGSVFFPLDGRGGEGEEEAGAVAGRGGRRIWRRFGTSSKVGDSGAGRRPAGGGSVGSATDLVFEIQLGDDPRSMAHNGGFVSSACGELLLRLVKPIMAMELARFRRCGDDGNCRVLMCYFYFMEVLFAIVPATVSLLGCSTSIRVYRVCIVCNFGCY